MEKRYLLAFGMGAASLALGILVVRLIGLGPSLPPLPPEEHDPPARSNNLSGPYTHKNLTVYLIHGERNLLGEAPLTLEEAMERKLVRVHETGDVNELEIENISRTEEVYVQAGDIVKGGRQDRVLAVDLIVPPNSGRMPLDAFCVEHGRWTARGDESTHEFNSAVESLPLKESKLAAKHSRSQAEVWESVEATQDRLSSAANTSVTSEVSRSSLPLTLENKFVRDKAEDYVQALREIINGKPDVIGFVFAINGYLNSADTYGSNALFSKLWPRLLKASAIEAIAKSRIDMPAGSTTPNAIADLMLSAEAATSVSQRTVTERIRMVTRETKDVVFIESRDRERGTWLHRNYLFLD